MTRKITKLVLVLLMFVSIFAVNSYNASAEDAKYVSIEYTDPTNTKRTVNVLSSKSYANNAEQYKTGTWIYNPYESDDKVFTKYTAFKDVDDKTSHLSSIQWLVSKSVTKGWINTDGTVEFRPYDSVARADMAAFVYRFAQAVKYVASNTTNQTSSFNDVNDKVAHYASIYWLASEEISKGWTEDGKTLYKPLDTIARADMAAFIYRLAKKLNLVNDEQVKDLTTNFSDIEKVDKNSDHYRGIVWMYTNKITTGWKDEKTGVETFAPYANIARADMAAFLERLVKLLTPVDTDGDLLGDDYVFTKKQDKDNNVLIDNQGNKYTLFTTVTEGFSPTPVEVEEARKQVYQIVGSMKYGVESLKVATSGEGLAKTDQWITQQDKDDMLDKIASANEKLADKTLTLEQIDKIKQDIITEYQSFMATKIHTGNGNGAGSVNPTLNTSSTTTENSATTVSKVYVELLGLDTDGSFYNQKLETSIVVDSDNDGKADFITSNVTKVTEVTDANVFKNQNGVQYVQSASDKDICTVYDAKKYTIEANDYTTIKGTPVTSLEKLYEVVSLSVKDENNATIENSKVTVEGFDKVDCTKTGDYQVTFKYGSASKTVTLKFEETKNEVYYWLEKNGVVDGTFHLSCTKINDNYKTLPEKYSLALTEGFIYITKAVVENSIIAPANFSNLFTSSVKLETIENFKMIDTSKVTSMENLFTGTKLDDEDLKELADWNVSSVTSMKQMFKLCNNLTSLDSLSKWDLKAVTNFVSMFGNCDNLKDKEVPSTWDLSEDHINSMFTDDPSQIKTN